MARSRTQQRLAANWVNIALTIISVTQGFLFGVLLQQFPLVVNYSWRSSSIIVLALFLLCVALALRVFQSVITGVLDDDSGRPYLDQFFILFVFGACQYYLVSRFEEIRKIGFNQFLTTFYGWGLALSLLAAFGYYSSLSRFKRAHSRGDRYLTEHWLQRRNILGATTIMGIHLLLLVSSLNIFNFALSEMGQVLLVVVMIAILIMNIKYSLRSTFGDNSQMSKSVSKIAIPKAEKLDVVIVPAQKEDVTELRKLIMRNFGYVYRTLFRSGEQGAILVPRMLESILQAHRGKHALGYESFLVAHPLGRRKEIAGMLMLQTSAERWRKLLTAWSMIQIVFLNLGVKGLFRVGSNWWDIRTVSQKVGKNELHIVYLAVNKNARNQHVGTQLLQHAREIANQKGKKLITLTVRASNDQAKSFFIHRGFSIEDVSDERKVDRTNILGQGEIVCMSDRGG